MFEDTIPWDENVIYIASRKASVAAYYAGIQSFVKVGLEDYLSKDSDLTRYNYSRLNGMVPEVPSFFSSVYPRKASNLDTDLHHLSFDVHVLTRWIPRDVLRFFVPVLYFQDLQNERMDKRAAALTAKPVPTVTELQACSRLRGRGFWTRKGEWICSRHELGNKRDTRGKVYFDTYDEFIVWEQNIDRQICSARQAGDYEMATSLRASKEQK